MTKSERLSFVKASQGCYSDHISKNGVYLGPGDLAMLATEKGADVCTLHWDDEVAGVPPAVSLPERIKGLASIDGALWETQKEKDQPEASWTVAWLCSNFVRGGFLRMNHSMPLVPKEQVPDWDQVSKTVLEKLSRKVKKAESKCQNCSESSDGEAEAVMASLIERRNILQQKQLFFETMITSGRLPLDVPGDGNCLIWSLACLMKGVCDIKNLPDEKTVAALRKVAWSYLRVIVIVHQSSSDILRLLNSIPCCL